MIRFLMMHSLLVIMMLILTSLSAIAKEIRLTCEDGIYSKVAAIPQGNNEKATVSEFSSPDGLNSIIVSEKPRSHPKVFVRVAEQEHLVEFSPWPCPEFQWAPDSSAFFLTYSDGGAVGTYEVLVYYPSEQGLEVINPSALVRKDFLSHYPKCFEPEIPNIGGVTWLDNSHRLLVAAEVVPHSNCDMMGTFSIYEIEVPSGKIIRKYNQLEAKRAFGHILGRELRNADDRCFTEPGSCNIPQLHEEKKP